MTKHSRLRIGNYLIIPVSKKRLLAADSQPKVLEETEQLPSPKVVPQDYAKADSCPSRARQSLPYAVKKGDTLGHIAEWVDVRASDLRNWNNIPYGRSIQVGQLINIWVPKEKMQQYENIASMSFDQKNALKKMPSAAKQVRVPRWMNRSTSETIGCSISEAGGKPGENSKRLQCCHRRSEKLEQAAPQQNLCGPVSRGLCPEFVGPINRVWSQPETSRDDRSTRKAEDDKAPGEKRGNTGKDRNAI